MFTQSTVGTGIKSMADSFKSLMADLFAPIQQSWNKYGQGVLNSWNYALATILALIVVIGTSFYNVWTNGTGVAVCDQILQILTNVLLVVGNIANGFKDAWNNNGTGEKIIQDLANILVILLQKIDAISAATADWSKTLDFSPLLTSVEKVTSALGPLTETIGSGLVWLYDNVLLPLAGWTISDFIPAFLDELAGGIKVVNSVIEALEPLGQWLWDSFLQPLASWYGGAAIGWMEGIATALNAISDWINNNQGVVQTFVIIVGSFAAAWGLVNIAIGIWNVVCAIATGVTTAFGVVVAFLTSPIGLVILAIGALIAAGVLLYQHWDTVKSFAVSIWGAIQGVFQSFGDWLQGVFSTDWTQSFGILGEGMNALFANISNIWGDIQQIFCGIIDFIGGVFTGDWEGAWNGVVEIFGGIFGGIEDLIKWPLNAVIGLINGAIDGINDISVDIPDWVPHWGGDHIGFSLGKIPYLAKGGIVRGATTAVIGEDGAEAVMPLENNTGWIDQLAAKVLSKMGGGSGSTPIQLTLPIYVGNKYLTTAVIDDINKITKSTGNCPIYV
jgi:phage-related protein